MCIRDSSVVVSTLSKTLAKCFPIKRCELSAPRYLRLNVAAARSGRTRDTIRRKETGPSPPARLHWYRERRADGSLRRHSGIFRSGDGDARCRQAARRVLLRQYVPVANAPVLHRRAGARPLDADLRGVPPRAGYSRLRTDECRPAAVHRLFRFSIRRFSRHEHCALLCSGLHARPIGFRVPARMGMARGTFRGLR